MRARNVVLFIVVLIPTVSTEAQPALRDPNLQVELFRDLLPSQPIGMAFLGPNDCLTLHKGSGQVYRSITSDASVVPTLALDLPVNSDSERGLLDIVLHPNFGIGSEPNNDKVYLYYSRSSTGGDSTMTSEWLENRLSQFTWNGSALVNETVLQVFGTSADGGAQGPNHNGGPIVFGPDGKLYGITGDLNRNEAEQNYQAQVNNSSQVGGIYRLNDDGTVPSDNPFSSHSNADFHRWFAYGIRNSFGLAFDPATGKLWDTENGPGSYDEVNFVAPGFNSGWEQIMGPDERDSQGVGNLVNLAPGGASTYSDPEFSWLDTVAPTAIHFLYGSALGDEYDDKVLVADNNTGQIYMFTLNAQRDGFVLTEGLADLVADSAAERDQLTLGTGFSVVTDFVRGPDGYVYAVSLGNRDVYRIFRPSGDYNDDGTVDAADYVVWRKTDGTQEGYDAWRAHFSQTTGSGATGSASAPTVPEPATLVMLMFAAAGWCFRRDRAA
jgi:glucose/arabinose dehydrogenase